MDSGDILEQINREMINQLPRRIDFKDVKVEHDDGTNVGVWGLDVCRFGYKVSAELQSCSNLNRVVQIKRLFSPSNVLRRDSNGNILVTLTPVIKMRDYVVCSGEAYARGSACGISMNAKAKEMGAGALIKVIGASIGATLDTSSSGKMCLKIDSVDGKVRQRDVDWAGFKMKFVGLPINIPGGVINDVFEKLPLQGPINDLVATLTGTLKDALDNMDLCTSLLR